MITARAAVTLGKLPPGRAQARGYQLTIHSDIRGASKIRLVLRVMGVMRSLAHAPAGLFATRVSC